MTNTTSVTTTAFNYPTDWRGKTLSLISQLIKEADPEITEDIKYRTKTNPDGVLVWYRDGMISTGEIYKKHLRLTLTKGQALKEYDSTNIINSFRAILLHEDDTLDKPAFQNLIREAVKLNQKGTSGKKSPK